MVAYEDIMVTNRRGQVQCRICNCFIPDNDYCIDQHISGNNHRVNYLEKLKKKHYIRVYDDEVRCNLCDEYVSSNEDLEYILEHIEEYEHQYNYNRLEELCGDDLTLPDGINGSVLVRCNLCHCNVASNERVLRQHLNGNRHIQAKCKAVQAENAIFDNDDAEASWCKLCDVVLEYDIQAIYDHIEEAGHIELLEEIENIISDQDINISDYLSVREQDKAYCERCDCFVPCTVQNLDEHVNGNKHNRE